MRLTGLPALGRIARTRPKPPPGLDGLAEIGDFGPNPGSLRMFVHVPARLPKSAPLVVILHGCGQTAADYALGTGWRDAADRLGFALLAPEQQNGNNMRCCFNWFQPGDIARDGGEAASIRQMIGRIIADQDLDSGRVFVTGLSAGGAMTAAMLAAYPEIFAGGAIIAGLPYGAASNVSEALNAMRRASGHSKHDWAEKMRKASAHAGPWPAVSVWHGDADATVHISNAEALVSQWTEIHGLPLHPTQTEEGPSHKRRSWQRPDGKTMLESYTFAGLAHGAPIHTGSGADSCGQAGPFFIEAGLSSTLQIADFWGLKQATPVAVKPVAVKDEVSAPPAPEPILPDIAPDPVVESHAPIHRVDGVRGVILKALKAAGLINKR